jgi:hypothetical protein
MGPIKDRYIHYEKAGDQFVGRNVSGISSLSIDFAVSPVHWDWTDAPFGSKEKMMWLIEDNLVARSGVSAPMFELLQFLFASICFHYKHLDENLHGTNRLRASPIFIAAGREKSLRKFSIINFPWTSTTYTPFATGIPPHVMLMSELQLLKASFEKQTTTVIEGMREELDKRNIGGDAYRSDCILQEIRAANESFINKLERLSPSQNLRSDEAVEVENNYFMLHSNIPLGEELGIETTVDDGARGDDGEQSQSDRLGNRDHSGGGDISTFPSSATVDDSRGLMISWENCRGGNILLTASSFCFPSMTFPNMLTM